MIQHYQAMQARVIQDENTLVVMKIMQKAKLFDVALFQNESVLQILLTMNFTEEVSPLQINALGKIVTWMGEVEKKAQMS